MLKSNWVEIEGTIAELLPSGRFTVRTEAGDTVLAVLSTRLSVGGAGRTLKAGDRVTLQLPVDEPLLGRIVRLDGTIPGLGGSWPAPNTGHGES